MARTRRQQKVAALIKKEVSDLLQKEIKDPRIGFVTVTDTEISGDLRHAKVFVSILKGDKEETMEGLKAAEGFVRSEIGDRIRLRHTPEILFKYDDSIEKGVRIFEILEDIKEDEEQDE
jgi:ribosome-binding factor A